MLGKNKSTRRIRIQTTTNSLRIAQLDLKIGALKSRETVSQSIMQEMSSWFPDCFSLILAIER
jgi:hypothetical protein